MSGVVGTGAIEQGRGTGSLPRFDWVGIDRAQRESTNTGVDDKGSHSLPVAPPFGMTSNDLYEYQLDFTQEAANRLLGVGKEQYDRGSKQKFEDMPIDDLVDGLREELMDIVNYATMIDIRFQRWSRAREHYALNTAPKVQSAS